MTRFQKKKEVEDVIFKRILMNEMYSADLELKLKIFQTFDRHVIYDLGML